MTTPPSPPSQLYSYTAFQQAQGDNTFPGTQLDADLANLVGSNTAIIAFINSAFRSDGKLANAFVNREALGPDIRIGFDPPTPWETAKAYAANEAVYYLNGFYFSTTAHTSGAFAADLANGLWTLAADFSEAAEAALIDFEKKYLGSFDTPPTVDNTGQPLETGALYFNSGAQEMYVWNGSGWQSTVASEARRREVIATATAGQTVFTVAGGYSPNQADVWVEGVKRRRGVDFVASNGTSVVMSVALTGGEFVNIVAYAAANLGYTTSDFVGFDPGIGSVTRSVEDKLKDTLNVRDYGAAGDGVTDDRAAFLLMDAEAGRIVVPKGTYRFAADTTLVNPISFEHGAVLVPASTVTLTINGSVEAPKYQQIFNTSASNAKVFGTFGSCVLHPTWWGAVPNGDAATPTNSYKAFVDCLDARHYTPGVCSSKVVVPAGNYYLSGAIRSAIPAGVGQPNLSEAAMLQMYIGDTFEGDGLMSAVLTIDNTLTGTGDIISMGGIDSSGPPTTVRNLFVAAKAGGAYAFTGNAIGAWANGAFVDNNWVSGFPFGVRVDSTDQIITKNVVEYCGTGFYVSSGTNNLTDNVTYLCGNGFVCDHKNDTGPSHFSGCRSNNRNGGLSGGYGMVFTGAYTKAKVVNCDVEAIPGGGVWTEAFAVFYTKGVQFSNCKATVVGNNLGFRVANATNVQIDNCLAYLVSGTGTTAAGIRVHSSSLNVQVRGCQVWGAFFYGIHVNTDGIAIQVEGNNVQGARNHGIFVERATDSFITNNYVGACGLGGGTTYGIGVSSTGQYESHQIVGNRVVQPNGGPQKYGIYAQLGDTSSAMIIALNSISYSSVSNLELIGGAVGSIISVNNKSLP